jgi:predicted hotdog family 3-hydroxylacyl-ACP dehydratase
MAPSEEIIASGDAVEAYIPQRKPMVMIGTLVSVSGVTTVTRYRITADNLFSSERFLREPGLIENMAQTAAAGAGYYAKKSGTLPRVGFIGGVNNLVIYKLPPAGAEITTEVTVAHEVMDASIVNGKIMLDGNLVAECELKIFLISPVTPS